jgi:hypothetical protein
MPLVVFAAVGNFTSHFVVGKCKGTVLPLAQECLACMLACSWLLSIASIQYKAGFQSMVVGARRFLAGT